MVKNKCYKVSAVLTLLLTVLVTGCIHTGKVSAKGTEEVRKAHELYGEAEHTDDTEKTMLVEEPKETQLYAKSAVLMDGQSGRVLYEKNGYEELPMASTTKIMTCIVALENGSMEDVVTASAYAAKMPKVKLGMRAEEQFKLGDLLYSLMLESHNDSAVAIAEHIGGSVEGFAELMNRKARDIGCYDTFFITPNGLDATATDGNGNTYTHSTTAADLARMMRYCFKESPEAEKFLEITGTASYSFGNVAGNRNFSCNNHNAFLHMMEGAVSGKTGFTNNAGYCYVGALERDGKSFVVALLACGWPYNKGYKWSDTKKLMEYGLTNYEFHQFTETPIETARLKPVMVENGQTEQIGETAYADVTLTGGSGSDSNIEGMLLRTDEIPEIMYDIKKSIQAPVDKGTPIGTIQYTVGGKVWKTVTVVTTENVPKTDYAWCFKQILERFFIGALR